MYFWIGIFILFTLFFGYLGLIFALISLGFYFLLKTKIIYFKNSRFKGLNKETKRENFMLNLEEIVDKQISEDFDINKLKSYKQILYYGDKKEKINLIGMVIYNPTADFVNLIRIALEDDDETVRILASTSLQKMETFYEDKIKEISKNLNSNKAKRVLINTYNNFIDSTLIDNSLKYIYINKIFKIFEDFENLQNDEKSKLLLIKMAIKYNKLELIKEIIENLKDFRTLSIDYKFLFLEYYFKRINLTKIYEILETIDRNKLSTPEQIESYDYWIKNAQ